MNIQQITKQGYTLVTSRAMAAAATFTCTDGTRPALELVNLVTANGTTSLWASDQYKAFICTSRKFAEGTNPEGEILVNPRELRQSKLVTNRPKDTAWLAIKGEMGPNGDRLHVIALEETRGGVRQVCEAFLTQHYYTRYPNIEQIFRDLAPKKQGTGAPTLNTSYVIDVFKAIELAVSHEGQVGTRIVHDDDLNHPILLDAFNKCESAKALVMPIRQ